MEQRRLSWIIAAGSLMVACDADPHGLAWGVSFASDAERDRAAIVEVTIREGSCEGTVRYQALIDVSLGGTATTRPPILDAGRYCLSGRARDAGCEWFVRGELEVDLPTEESPKIVLLNVADGGDACSLDQCRDGLCTGETIDGGMDAGPDGGDTGTSDASPDSSPDSRPPDTGIPDGCSPVAELCNGGDDDCDGRVDETFDLMADDANCGACGNACTGDLGCVSGACDCVPPLVLDPPDRCRDVTSDASHCGAIGNRCRDDQWCRDSTCECRPGLTDVSGSCSDLSSDPQNCGSIGNDCSTMGSMVTCRDSCEDACNPGQTNCSNACVDVDGDPLNCGGCGNVCQHNRFCRNGLCLRYEVATSCSSCPCTAECRGDFGECTSYGPAIICYDE